MIARISKREILIAAAFGFALWLLFFFSAPLSKVISGRNDFMQLYAGARLVGTDGLYQPEAVYREQARAIGAVMPSVLFTRLPAYAFLLKPLGLLPYQAAYAVFQCVSAAALIGFLLLHGSRYPLVLVFTPLSLPLLFVLLNGQDLTLVLFFAALSLYLARRGRKGLAGLALSLCAIKFHLFVLVAAALLCRKEWRFAAGAAAGIGAAAGASTLLQGNGWIPAYLALAANPVIHPDLFAMPTLRGLSENLLPRARGLLPLLTLAVAAAFVWAARRVRGSEFGFFLALAGGIVVSPHAYAQDLVLLLIGLPVLAESLQGRLAAVLTALLGTPLPFMLCLLPPPAPSFSALLLLALVPLSLAAAGRCAGAPFPAAAGKTPAAGSSVHDTPAGLRQDSRLAL